MGKLFTSIPVVLLLLAGAAPANLAQSPSAPAKQPAPSPAAPAAETPMQPFTTMVGRFSALFPGTPTQSSQLIHLKNGETTTLYEFSANTDNNTTSYIVIYNDYAPDVVAAGPADLLQKAENGAVAGKTLLSDQAINVRGVPGRTYTASDSNGYSYTVREFLAGTRLYQVIVATAKGSTATQLNLFMNSFIIL
jgi:hypothetical protein